MYIDYKRDLTELVKSKNIAQDMLESEEGKEDLEKIGHQVYDSYDTDLGSMQDWLDRAKRIMKLVQTPTGLKDYPWVGSANVHYPLATDAITQIAARVYGELVKNKKVVGANVMGKDPDGTKIARATRISDYMSYQLLVESPDWKEQMERTINTLLCVGTIHKKTYYDKLKQRNCSNLCKFDELIINKSVTSLEDAPRISHCLPITADSFISKVRAGIFIEMDKEEIEHELKASSYNSDSASMADEYDDIYVLEQYRRLDLDGDGYPEPYIVTCLEATKKVVRIVANYDLQDIKYNAKQEVVTIPPVEYFTDYHCIPSMDGTYWSDGIGTRLLHINEVVNTTLNTLINAGNLATAQGGIFSNKVEVKGGTIKLKPGHWQQVTIKGQGTLKDEMMPIEYKSPDPVLYNLLELCLQAGKESAAISDSMVGQQQAQDVKTGAMNILQSEGGKLISSIQRRVNDGLTKEFQKLYRLNSIYLDDQVYVSTLDDKAAILRQDFALPDIDVRPMADPNLSSEFQRAQQATSYMQLLQLPMINAPEITKRVITAMEVPDPEKLMANPTPPPPDPKLLKVQADQQADQMDFQIKQAELQLKEKTLQLEVMKLQAEVQNLQSQSFKNNTDANATIVQQHLAMDQQGIDAALEHKALALQAQQANTQAVIDAHKADTARIQANKPTPTRGE